MPKSPNRSGPQGPAGIPPARNITSLEDLEFPPVRYRILVAITFITALIPVFMSGTMVNVAITDIMGAYGIGQEKVHWVSTGFMAASTLAMLLNGWFVGNIGPRRTYLFSMILFLGASLGTQFADEFSFLVAMRLLQGFCAGLLQPLSATVFFAIFPLAQRGKAMAFFSMGVVMAPAFGPYLGGVITDGFGWQYIFLPALPACFIACAMALHWIPMSLPIGQIRAFNWTSFVLVTASIIGFFWALANGQQEGWSEVSAVMPLLAAMILFVIFVWWELHTRTPLLEVRIFTERNFAMASIVGFVFGMGMFASIYILPQFIRSVQGLDATTAGLILVPGGIAMMVTSSISGTLAQIWSPRRTISIGLLLFAGSSLLYYDANIETSLIFLTVLAVVGRVGLSTIMPSLQLHGVRFLAPQLMPFGNGTLNFIRQLGGAIGINVAALVLDYRYVGHRESLIATQTPDNHTTMETLARLGELLRREGFDSLQTTYQAMGYLMRAVNAKATTLAFQDTFIFVGAFFVFALIPTLFLSGRTLQDTLREMQSEKKIGTAAAGRPA